MRSGGELNFSAFEIVKNVVFWHDVICVWWFFSIR